MPDTKFSFAKLREHARKHLWVYIIGIAVCLVLTNLLWTTTAPRIPSDQSLVIYLADMWSDPSALDAISRDVLEKLQADTDIREVDFQSLAYGDPSQDYTSAMLLMTRLATGECDAFLCNQACMDALLQSGVVLPLDDLVAGGWLSSYGLEPWYASVADEETGEERTILAGLRLDSVDRLMELRAFNNEGAFLVLTSFDENQAETVKAMEYLLSDLTEAGDA